MGIIRYNENAVVSARNKINIYNEQILDTLRKVYDETNTISSILDTPKANKNLAEFLQYMQGRIDYAGNSKTAINDKLLAVETIYREDFMNTVSQMVGGNND